MGRSARKTAAQERKIGKVEFLAEKINDARELSSCCVGTEALLEADNQPVKARRQTDESKPRR